MLTRKRRNENIPRPPDEQCPPPYPLSLQHGALFTVPFPAHLLNFPTGFHPTPACECAPLPPPPGSHSLAGEGVGKSQFRRLEKKLSTLPTLWYYTNTTLLTFASFFFADYTWVLCEWPASRPYFLLLPVCHPGVRRVHSAHAGVHGVHGGLVLPPPADEPGLLAGRRKRFLSRIRLTFPLKRWNRRKLETII
jgi:hypothetical protein